VVTYPLPLLKQLNIVDSPGTNAIVRIHERLTDEFVPRSDLVLFTTSADRPLTESERLFLERILSWGKKVAFVLNKADIFENETALQEARDYILDHATSILGYRPLLFAVSARNAQRALSSVDESEKTLLRSESGLNALEEYISSTLDDAARLKLKFKSPLGVADHLIATAGNLIADQAQDLDEDFKTVSALETALNGYAHDLETELVPRLAEVENILTKFEMRGLDFFDRTMRLTRIHKLVRGEKVRAAFEKEVLMDIADQVDDQVQRIIDWLVDKDLREWQQVMMTLQKRQALNQDRIISGGISPQQIRRKELIEKVSEKVSSIVGSYDRVKEASHLAADVESAVAQTALFEAGAIGLGALVSTALLSSALDITGIIAASTLAIVGLFVIPFKRSRAKENFRKKVSDLRSRLNELLSGVFRNESENALSRMRENIAPYTRFVHSEQERIQRTKEILAEMQEKSKILHGRIEQVLQ
jgi:ribosomal protein L17